MSSVTTTQLTFDDLYGGVPPHQKHSATSTGAALTLSAARRATLLAAVLRFLQQCDWRGATDEEIQIGLHIDGNTERPRRCELLEAGLIVDSRTTRKTTKGKPAVVWSVTPARASY